MRKLAPSPAGEGWGEGAALTLCDSLKGNPHPLPSPLGEGLKRLMCDCPQKNKSASIKPTK
jgi:hypothetical protein